MIFSKVMMHAIDIRESMVYIDCYDIFNCWPGLCLRKKGITTVEIGLKVIAGLGEKCVITDRYGFCVTNYIEVENMAVEDDKPIKLKLINRTNRDIIIDHGEILCQVMVLNIDMIGR